MTVTDTAARTAGSLAARVLERVPESTTRPVLKSVLGRTRSRWGMGDDGGRLRCLRQSYEQAFPSEDVDAFEQRWIAARVDAMGATLPALARMVARRETAALVPGEGLDTELKGPLVVAFLHYAIDPLAQIELLRRAPGFFKWPNYPIQDADDTGDTWGDDRSAWLRLGDVPPDVADSLLPITDTRWALDALRHLRKDGGLLVAMDVAFEGSSKPAAHIEVGAARHPVSGALGALEEQDGEMAFLAPSPCAPGRWRLDLRRVAGVEELAAAASEWIERNPEQWAGWPFIACRDSIESVRDTADEVTA